MRNVLLFFAFIFSQIIFSQISISGIIHDENAQPIPYVNIIITKASDSTLVKGLISQDNGKFNFELKKQDNYNLTLSFVGYKTESFNFSNSKEFGIISLKPSLEALDDVVINAQKPFIQRQQDKLIVNVEGSIISVGNTTIEVLEKSPGIVVDQDGNLSLSGRNGVRFFLDGKDTMLQGDDLTNLLRSMPSSNIEKVEIITNPSVKYEAQGNAGIINIVTKKGKLYGTNGNITISPGQGRYFRWENSLNINHRNEKFNLYGQYSFAKRKQWMKIDIDREFIDDNNEVESFYRLRNLFELPIENHSPRIGLDYYVSSNTTLGLLLTGIFNINGSESTNNTNQFDSNGNLVSIQNTVSDVESKWNQLTGNLNVNHKFGNNSILDFDFDIARYDNHSNQSYDSEYFDTQGEISNENLLTGLVDGYLDLVGLSLDYEMPFENGNKFEAGWKNTWVTTDNDLEYFDTTNGMTTPNELLTNRFIYDENIYGAYLSYNINKEKWNAQFGLRGEYTQIKGNQVTADIQFENNYFELFPSLSYNYSVNENNVLGVSFGRRIDRPSYSQLNPFRFFVDTNTFRVGNPLLRPQFTWIGELNYTLKNKYYFAFSYGHTKDNLNMGILQDGENQGVLIQPINIESLKSYSLTVSLPIKFTNWWQSNWNLNASYNNFDGLVAGSQLNRSTPVVSLNSSHSFNLGNDYKLQLGTFNLFPHYVSITKIEEISSVSIGGQKTILDGNGIIRLNVNDIFFNQYPVGVTNFGGINDKFRSYRDTRYATLSFTWKFGKHTVKTQNSRRTGVQEELNRAQQQNN